MQAQTAQGKRLWFLTLTAPGVNDHRRWSPKQHYRRGAHREVCKCHVGVDLADWNPTAGACWNRLRTALRRLDHLEYYRAAEVQDGTRRADGIGRGALHHHLVIAAKGMPDVLQLQELALAAGYGCIVDLEDVPAGADLMDLAAYAAKRLSGYVAKSAVRNNRDTVPWRVEMVNTDTGELRKVETWATYQTHTQSRGWGCTIKEVKAYAQAQARRRAKVLLDSMQGMPGQDSDGVSGERAVSNLSAGPEPP